MLFNTVLKMPGSMTTRILITQWVEEDYCSPPLAMERESVLDQYFNDIEVLRVESEEQGWNMIKEKPSLWDKKGHTRSQR
jgi:hypothetical protein